MNVWVDEPSGQYIRAEKTGEVWEVTTDLSEPDDLSPWGVATDTLTSFILAQASAGIDVFSPAYKDAVQTTIDCMVNNFGDD